MGPDFRESVLDAAQRPEVRRAVEALYARVQQEIEQRRPICLVSGRCCRFEQFGHRLYVTTLELAAFMSASGSVTGRDVDRAAAWGVKPESGCPFQLDRLCTVHSIRPFGCRIFFCDATAADWQAQAYERFHGELKRLHDQLGVRYFYMEWREALSQCRTWPI